VCVVSGWLPRKVHEKERKWKMLDIVFCVVLVKVMNVVKCFENIVFFFSLKFIIIRGNQTEVKLFN
jgi:hypothetical protein